MGNNLYVDIHVIQTVPPSCVNRDDTGSPKTAVYGGVTRARVSSQSWKKAVRDAFRNESLFATEKLSARTKKAATMIAAEVAKIDSSIDTVRANEYAKEVLVAAGIKEFEKEDSKTQKNDTSALFFISSAQAKALAQLIINNLDANQKLTKIPEDSAKKAITELPGIDIALFGRMVAGVASLTTNACAQVAHAISTHRVNTEFDYFTAVDDLAPADKHRTEHIGTVEFNSSTLYRYATIAVHGLAEYLGEDTIDSVCEFIRIFACSMPTGKQNTFANRTTPDAMLVTLRTDQPVNLVGAFEKPVETRGGYVEDSINAFIKHTKKTYADWIKEPKASFVVGDALSELGQPRSLSESLVAFKHALSAILSNDEEI